MKWGGYEIAGPEEKFRKDRHIYGHQTQYCLTA